MGGVILGFIFAKTIDAPVGVDYRPPAYSSPSPDNLVTILFTGDVMLGRSVNKNIQDSRNPSWPFVYVQDILASADITYINLENPLISDCPVVESGMKFCGDIGNVAGLVNSGIDVVSLANNHTSNYGLDGLNETIATLESNNIKAIGGARSTTLVSGNHKYTFYSYNDVGEDAFKWVIKFPKQNHELVIVTFHWGAEYQFTPTSRQVTLARLAIDSGADLVLGAHPHWVQTSEIYKGKPIYYSLGNFVFDQEWSAETKRGLAVRFTYLGLDLHQTEELPVLIENYGQPRWQ